MVEYLNRVLEALGLQDVLVQTELYLFSERPDIAILFKSDVPVGVIEVKVPDGNPMNDKLFAGQLFDYMEMLHSTFGVQNVFGIMTTYHEWRICWLKGTVLNTAATLEAAKAQAVNLSDPVPFPLPLELDDSDHDTTTISTAAAAATTTTTTTGNVWNRCHSLQL